MSHSIPPARPAISLEAITAHLTALAATGFCPHCEPGAVRPVITDTFRLLSELARLYEELAGLRLENANLRAAINAALSAAADGETDPLDYLRWELPEPPSPDTGGWCG
jgi:hypothetical protein